MNIAFALPWKPIPVWKHVRRNPEMADIVYQELERFLEKARGRGHSALPRVCLLFGEEMLVKRSLEKVRAALLGEGPTDMDCDVLEGLNENVAAALERVNTYALLSQGKVVVLADARIFQSRQNTERLWDLAGRAVRAGEMKKAARHFLDILSLKNLALDDLDGTTSTDVLAPPAEDAAMDWIPAVRDYCRQNGMRVPAAADPQQELQAAVERGFPAGNHLLITTEVVDKRRSLFKAIREKGLVVDCSVPKGDRKADRDAQAATMEATVDEVLRPSGKRMEPAARRTLFELTGFDLRAVAAAVEKLVNYIGDRERIGVDDVRQALARTRRDPLYALTEAVSNRQLSAALFYLDSLLTGGDFDHPLPLLAAVANQMRRLLVARDFLSGPHGRAWRSGCAYPQFQAGVLPAVKAFDADLQSTMTRWEEALRDAASVAEKPPRTKTPKAAPRSDLFMGQGRSAFPVYKTLQKAERFTRDELIRIMGRISDADRRLKRSGSSGRMVLEELIFSICLGEEGAPADPRRG